MSRRASSIRILLALALLLSALPARALTNGVALLPPMGFNSFYAYNVGISDSIIKSVADAFVTNGMLAAGYNYINIDDGWAGQRDTNGAISADTNKFPSGMKSLVDYLHAEGFKVGIYTTASSNTCANYPGSQNHLVQDVNTFASWGIDYVKYEGCQIPSYEIFPRQQVYAARMRQALAQCGRPMVYSLSIGGAFENWMPQYINVWRGTGDLNGQWASVLNHIDFVARTPSFAGPGGWNDPDVMGIGSGAFSEDECTSIFTMWCMLASPLLVLHGETPHTNILCNRELIAVDQDAGCIQGVSVVSNNNLQVWRKPLGSLNSGVMAVALFNRDGPATNITANWSDLGLTPGVNAVWDLWAHAFAGDFTNSFTANIPLHSVRALRITNGVIMPLPPVGTNFVSNLGWMADVTSGVNFPGNYPYAKSLSGGLTQMSLRGTKYTNGLGMIVYTRIRYFLGGTASRFQSDIGVDDIATPFGSVIFRVYGDGTKIFESGTLTSQSAIQSVDLSLSNYNFVTLEVSNAVPNTANDYSDWGNARITFLALPPRTPGNLSASLLTNEFAVTWFAVSGATKYVLSRGTVSGGPYTPISTNTTPTYLDTNVVGGTIYFYVVSAVNANGASTNSIEFATSLPAYWTNTQTAATQDWNVNANWTNTTAFPNRLAAAAVISPAISANQTINLNQAITIGALALGATNGSAAINLAANGGTLTFDNDTSPASLTELASAAGDTLSTTLVLNQNLTVTNLAMNFLTLAGAITGVGSLTLNGPGPLLLNVSNSFAGPVIITGGLLKIGSAAALGPTNSTMTITNNGTFDLNGFNLSSKSVTVSGAGVNGSGAIISTSASTQSNALRSITLAGDTTIGGTARWDIRGTTNISPSGVLSTSGNTFGLTKTGTNQISLASITIDSALGDINVNAGVLSFENATTSMGDPSRHLNVQSGATLSFVQTTNLWNKNIALDGNGITPTITSSGTNIIIGPVNFSDTCVLNVTNGSLTLNGPLGGTGSFVKELAGTLFLGATSNGGFAGNIIVDGGTLALQNAAAIANCPLITVMPGAMLDVTAVGPGFTLAAGQTLTGGGTVNGNVTVGNQATLQPDDSFGVPAFNNSLTFLPGSTCVRDIIGPPPFTNGELHVTGTLTYGGTLVVNNLASNSLVVGNTFKFFDAGSYNGSFINIQPPVPGTNILWDTTHLAISGTLGIMSGTPPRFTNYSNQGNKVVFSGVSGVSNAPYYYVFTATNPVLSAEWTPIATNLFDAQGGFTFTNTINPNAPAVYFRIGVP